MLLTINTISIFKIKSILKKAILLLLLILCVSSFCDFFFNKVKRFKIHVTFVHDMDTNEQVTLENLKYFLHFAYKPCNEEVDYTFIFNKKIMNPFTSKNYPVYGLTQELKEYLGKIIDLNLFKCSVSDEISKSTLFITDSYIGGDICSYSYYIKTKWFLKKKFIYDFFFYINSTVRGPFLPIYWEKPW